MEMRKYEFIDFIEGDFKYKEKDVSKSNVYSIELKNSNLNYDVIDYNKMKARLDAYISTNEGRSLSGSAFLPAIHNMGYEEILDITMSEDAEMLKKTDFEIPIESYKFYYKDNPLNENIHTKMILRKQLEKTIKKSISRYAPINTTLWKIKYTGI